MEKIKEPRPFYGGLFVELVLFFLLNVLLLTSCSKDNKEEPAVNKTNYQMKTSQPIEFKYYEASKGNSTVLSYTNVESYFGKRVELGVPLSLQFEDDKIVINKAYGLKETYKVKWADNTLLLYDEKTDKWIEFATKSTDGKIILYMEFYRQEENTTSRQLVSLGQGYNLSLLDGLLNAMNNTSKVVWLKMAYTFE
ncbi:MAG: hypothetical protein GX416_03615 [Bacteroidales bacterium]|nr:hypothetical protein [Bacteroidales bacterium]